MTPTNEPAAHQEKKADLRSSANQDSPAASAVSTSGDVAFVMHLQRNAGNAAVNGLIRQIQRASRRKDGLAETASRSRPPPISRATISRDATPAPSVPDAGPAPAIPLMTDVDGQTIHSIKGDLTQPGSWAQNFVEFFQLIRKPDPLSATLDEKFMFQRAAKQRIMTVTELIETMIAQAAADSIVLDRTVAMGTIMSHLPPRPAGPSTSRVAFYFTFSFVRTAHVASTGPQSRPDSAGPQAAFQATLELHKDGQSGPEFSWVGQVSAFRDSSGDGEQYKGPYKLQSAFTGFQAEWVFSFLDGALQLAPLVQALGGVSRAQQASDGMLRFVPTAQAALGGQIVYQFGSTPLQIGGQAAAAFTDPKGAPSTGDVQSGVFLQWKF